MLSTVGRRREQGADWRPDGVVGGVRGCGWVDLGVLGCKVRVVVEARHTAVQHRVEEVDVVVVGQPSQVGVGGL